MGRVVEVVYDGEVFRPVKPVEELTPSAHYDIEIREEKRPIKRVESIWDVLDRYEGSIEAPEDWSLEHDHYIHGTAKKHERRAE